jgi:hypothetical protein
MSENTNDTHEAQQVAEAAELEGPTYATSARTKYILIAVIVVLAFAVSYGIAQARTGASGEFAAEGASAQVATAGGGGQAAGGG